MARLKHMISTLLTLGMASLTFAPVVQAKTFNIGGPNPASQIFTVESQADFEDFIGRTNEITGKLTYDAKKKIGTANVTVKLANLDTGIPLRNEHMKSSQWLDAAKFPEAKFDVTNTKALGSDKYAITGKLTLKGVTKTITGEAIIKYFPESASTKAARFNGDVLQVKGSVRIKLSDYNILIPAGAKTKVSEIVTLKLSVFATTG